VEKEVRGAVVSAMIGKRIPDRHGIPHQSGLQFSQLECTYIGAGL
jgi:hypothetical protein